MKSVLFHMRGVREWNLVIHEYAPDDRATGTMTVTNRHGTRVMRMTGVLDKRWMDEIGCDEMRLLDENDRTGNQLEFGRYALEFWHSGELSASFPIDSCDPL